MSNQTNSNATNNPFDPKKLVSGLTETSIPANVHGTVFKETCSSLEKKLEDLLAVNCNIPELDHILIYPRMSNRGGSVEEIKCYAYFNTSMAGASNITRGGTNNNNGGGERKTIFDFDPIKSSGNFKLSDNFKKVIAPITNLDDNGNIIVSTVKSDSRVAIVELDFFLAGALALRVTDEEPYNFTVLAVEQTNNYRPGGSLEDAILLIMKYIDTNTRRGRNRGNGRHIDYRAMDRELINRSRGGGNNNGGGRSY